MSIGRNFDQRSKNIDGLFDMLTEVQKKNGIEPTMTEALFDPVTKERINVFKRKKLEASGVDLSKYGEGNTKCKSCNKCEEKKMSNIERGVFVYNEDDLVDEEEGGIYVCEYCTHIGYDNAYRPEVCDMCDSCEECMDYINGECDGCEYSATFNSGRSYGELSTDTKITLNTEDESLIEEVKEDIPDYEVKKPVGGFTIMNY